MIDILEVKNGVKNWIDSMRYRDTGLYLYNRGVKRPTLLSNCFAVLGQELLGGLNGSMHRLISYIKDCQDRDSGLFIDPLLRKEDLLRPDAHSWDYVTMQSTKFSINALDALGERPRYGLNFLDKYKDIDFLIRWLEGRNWKNPWLESNNIMFVGCFLLYEYIWTGDKRNLEILGSFLDWHDKAQDPKTGYWGTDKGASLHNGMAGAFHIYLLYYYLNRPINYKEKIIDVTLSLQHEDGLFTEDGGGGSCEDLDAIDILAKFTTFTDYRKEDIKKALFRSLETLIKGQRRDGGYSWKINTQNKIANEFGIFGKRSFYSSWRLMPFNVNRSDMWSGWFRPLAIALIASTYPDEIGSNFKFNFRRLPGLGWHFK